MTRTIGFGGFLTVTVILALAAAAPGDTMLVFTSLHDFHNPSGGTTEAPATISGVGATSVSMPLRNALNQLTGVTVTLAGMKGSEPQTLTANDGGSHPDTGTDAADIFGAGVPLDGAGSVGDLNAQTLILTFTGLRTDPENLYDVAVYSDVSVPGGGTRHMEYTISGAVSFENTSSDGTTISGVNDETTTIADVEGNYLTGYVARFSDIYTSTGSFTITMIDESNGPIVNAVYLGGVPEPATVSLLALGGLAILFRRRRRA